VEVILWLCILMNCDADERQRSNDSGYTDPTKHQPSDG
jgi:hypothetical protein